MAELLIGVRLVGGLLLLLANGVFVTTEFALTRVRQFPREEFDTEGGLARAWEMTERLEIYLSGCQVGITISSVTLGVVAEPAVAAVLDPVVRMAGIGNTVGQAGHTATAVIISLGSSTCSTSVSASRFRPTWASNAPRPSPDTVRQCATGGRA